MSDSISKYMEDKEQTDIAGPIKARENEMLLLTAIKYEVKDEALRRAHDFNEVYEEQMFDWSREIEKAENTGIYTEQPYQEPFEFERDDYIETDRKFRIRKDDIRTYEENKFDVTVIVTEEGREVAIRESIEYLDKIFEK